MHSFFGGSVDLQPKKNHSRQVQELLLREESKGPGGRLENQQHAPQDTQAPSPCQRRAELSHPNLVYGGLI
jgi:hypothetical protein